MSAAEVEVQTQGAGKPPRPPVRTAWPSDDSEDKPKRKPKAGAPEQDIILPPENPPANPEWLARLDQGMRAATERLP